MEQRLWRKAKLRVTLPLLHLLLGDEDLLLHELGLHEDGVQLFLLCGDRLFSLVRGSSLHSGKPEQHLWPEGTGEGLNGDEEQNREGHNLWPDRIGEEHSEGTR